MEAHEYALFVSWGKAPVIRGLDVNFGLDFPEQDDTSKLITAAHLKSLLLDEFGVNIEEKDEDDEYEEDLQEDDEIKLSKEQANKLEEAEAEQITMQNNIEYLLEKIESQKKEGKPINQQDDERLIKLVEMKSKAIGKKEVESIYPNEWKYLEEKRNENKSEHQTKTTTKNPQKQEGEKKEEKVEEKHYQVRETPKEETLKEIKKPQALKEYSSNVSHNSSPLVGGNKGYDNNIRTIDNYREPQNIYKKQTSQEYPINTSKFTKRNNIRDNNTGITDGDYRRKPQTKVLQSEKNQIFESLGQVNNNTIKPQEFIKPSPSPKVDSPLTPPKQQNLPITPKQSNLPTTPPEQRDLSQQKDDKQPIKQRFEAKSSPEASSNPKKQDDIYEDAQFNLELSSSVFEKRGIVLDALTTSKNVFNARNFESDSFLNLLSFCAKHPILCRESKIRDSFLMNGEDLDVAKDKAKKIRNFIKDNKSDLKKISKLLNKKNVTDRDLDKIDKIKEKIKFKYCNSALKDFGKEKITPPVNDAGKVASPSPDGNESSESSKRQAEEIEKKAKKQHKSKGHEL
jgi:hypothetical protein